MHKFNYDVLKDRTITSTLFSLSNIITDLRCKTEEKQKTNSALFTRLESMAIKESVKGSNAIEGLYTTEQRIKEIVEFDSVPLTHDEEEIAGYHDAIRFITDNYEHISFTEETIKKIHALIAGRHVGYQKAGKYKEEDNIIAEKHPDGTIKRVIFSPVRSEETELAMKELVLAYNVAKDDYSIPPLLLIPCVIVDFLSIHPFSDGNGRVSRLLTLLLLYKAGYKIGKYISFENQINEYKNSYYSALERSQKDWHISDNTYYPFIEFTFQILYQCYKEINRRFIVTKTGKDKKKDRIESVVLDSLVPMSKSDISYLLPDVSVTTIESVLSALLKQNKIFKIGLGRDTKYMKK